MDFVAVAKRFNTHAVTYTGVGIGIATAITSAGLQLARLLGDWKFDVDLGHAVRTGKDPNHDIVQVVAPVLAMVVLSLVALTLTAIGLAPQIKSAGNGGVKP